MICERVVVEIIQPGPAFYNGCYVFPIPGIGYWQRVSVQHPLAQSRNRCRATTACEKDALFQRLVYNDNRRKRPLSGTQR